MINSNNTDIKESFWRLVKKWSDFLGILLSPSVLIVLLTTILLIYFSPNDQDIPESVLNILTVIISIFAGVVGALISKKWSELNDGSILVTRGKSAIRGLKLLLLNLSSLEHRVNVHLSRLDDEELSVDLTKNNLEEIIERCNTLQEETLNAVEEWQDIIPEANIKTKIGFLSQLKNEKNKLEDQIQDLNTELNTTKNKSEENTKELNKKLKEKEKELRNVKEELIDKEQELNSSLLSGLPSYDDIGVGGHLKRSSENLYLNQKYHCRECGEDFTKPSDRSSLVSALLTPNCPNCGSDNIAHEF